MNRVDAHAAPLPLLACAEGSVALVARQSAPVVLASNAGTPGP